MVKLVSTVKILFLVVVVASTGLFVFHSPLGEYLGLRTAKRSAVVGWVNATHYISANFTLKPKMTVRDTFLWEEPRPEEKLAFFQMEVFTCEREGVIEIYINDERFGASFLSEETAITKESNVAPCCAGFFITPRRENSVVVISHDYQGTLRFILFFPKL